LSEKLQKLEAEQLKVLEEGLDMLVTMLNLQEVEASPVLTAESELYDPDTN
jgi:hypothetical protein